MRLTVSFLLLLFGCTGELSVDDDGGATGMDATVLPGTDAGPVPPGTDAGPRPPRSDGSPGGSDAGPPPPGVDAGPCAGGLSDDFSLTPIAGLSASSNPHAAAAGDGLVVALTDGDGVRLVTVTLSGSIRADHAVSGNRAWGVAHAEDGANGVLIDRSSDELWLVVLESGGATRFETRLLGGIPHDVTNNEWFGTGIRAGRMTWTGTQWATYHTVQRLWPDDIAHYGDTLRFLDADTGAEDSGGWGWGCSHSMEVAITQNASRTGPVCVSDCFPGKGVFFQHRTSLFDDPSGDCAGRIDTRLGGIAAASDGFWVAFVSPNGRSSADVAIQHVANDRSVGEVIWLTSDATPDTNVHIAPFGDGTLVGWSAGGVDRLARVDAAGAIIGTPTDIPNAGLAGASDFVAFAGGDVAWITASGGMSAIARVRACF